MNSKEIFDKLNSIDIEEKKNPHSYVIKVNAYIDTLDESLPSGAGNYDEQTLEDWYDFAATVEGIVDNYCDTVNISLIKNPYSLSEYIDFYCFDSAGNKKNVLIDLRLSDHKATSAARKVRNVKASKIDNNYDLVTVIVNDKYFDSYHDALQYIRQLLVKLSK